MSMGLYNRTRILFPSSHSCIILAFTLFFCRVEYSYGSWQKAVGGWQ